VTVIETEIGADEPAASAAAPRERLGPAAAGWWRADPARPVSGAWPARRA
jgi:hypothetical protein